ncbi:hypothetical protein ACFQ7A_02340 [Streptomyces sp. NPDC056528]|uniref:hypothetical protein n=1 Tax=Streptomyces sp. NPDC056528 TaxID=3345854 RepID=UPI003695B6D0
MADERYQWLDEEAAERLLRGGPVDPVGPADDLARLRAARLAETLDAIRAPAAQDGDGLPGEAAALAAFREAVAARAAASGARNAAGGVGGGTARSADPVDLGRVRLARPVAAPRRWGRSARYGLAAAVAAVTVGGVAVAAGTGALPLVGPAPASSVSAGETARPLVSPEHGGLREDPGIPGPPPSAGDRTPGTSPSTGTGSTAPATPAPGGDGADRPKRDVPEPDRSTAGPDGTPDPDRTDGRDRDGSGGTDSREKAVEACRAYRSGKFDDGHRRLLTETRRKGETLRRYCDRLLSDAPHAPGAPGDGAEDGSDSGSRDGSRDRPGDGSEGDPKDDGKGDGRGGSRGRGGDGRDGARTSAETLAGPATATPATPAALPETGATTRLPLAV